MAIRGLTDQYKAKLEHDPRGKPVRLGYLQKGKREGFGKQIRLFDLDHFVFKAANQDENTAAAIEAIFTEVYGPKPREIGDVRIPVSLAGNFDIESCAWMTAHKHTEKGSIFLAQGDGRTITRMRDEKGKVHFIEDGLPFDDYTRNDDKGKPHFIYRKKLYPWQYSMAIDLILPELNEELFQRRIAGLGVVTLLTHAQYDIPTLIGEYYKMLDELVAIFADPRDPASVERVRRNAPLRSIPIRLFRSEDKITSPAYGRDADPADRVKRTSWLLHWQLNAEFGLKTQQALTQRTALLLEAVGQGVPLIAAPRHTVDSVNADLLGLPAPASNGGSGGNGSPKEEKRVEAKFEAIEADFSEMSETDDLEAEEVEIVHDDQPEDEVDPWAEQLDEERQPAVNFDYWEKAAVNAKDLDAFAMAIYQLHSVSGTFADAVAAKKGYNYMCGIFDTSKNEAALNAINLYANAVADGTSKKEAVEAAKKFFTEKTTPKARAKRPSKKLIETTAPQGAFDD